MASAGSLRAAIPMKCRGPFWAAGTPVDAGALCEAASAADCGPPGRRQVQELPFFCSGRVASCVVGGSGLCCVRRSRRPIGLKERKWRVIEGFTLQHPFRHQVCYDLVLGLAFGLASLFESLFLWPCETRRHGAKVRSVVCRSIFPRPAYGGAFLGITQRQAPPLRIQ